MTTEDTKVNTRLKLTGALALMSALLIGCSGGASSGGGSGSDVTLSGVVSTSGPASAGGGVQKTVGGVSAAAVTDLSNYKLFCVTFTDSPKSGTGNLSGPDGNGDYSYNVTLTDAAGLPIGCFINDDTNAPVATVSFNISGDTGISGSGSSGAALTGGSHDVNITFDPNTGTASATVSAGSVDSSAETSDASSFIANMKGPWSMACADSSDTQCQSMIGSSPNVFVDIISGTDGTNTLYAMGAWPDKATYDGCGSTEGLDATALNNQGISSPTSYTTGGSVTNPFSAGVMAAIAGNLTYNSTNETWEISFDNLYADISGSGLGFTYSDPSSGGSCSGVTVSNMSTADQRGCYMWALSNAIENGTLSCGPRFDGSTWNAAWDATVNDGLGTVSIQTQLGSSPAIRDRYSLMGLEILGGTGIASENFHENWDEWDSTLNGGSGGTKTCYYSEEMTITFTPGSTSNSAVGRFARKEFNSCVDSQPQLHTFDVNFTRL
jgi:hypothetical protein